ncbi:MAG: protein translocase subunit SecF [Candidatus Eisenbacteria bacterium]|nr:protein translocase subunit SecF [Candidatus Eisenbacteria bacterium]
MLQVLHGARVPFMQNRKYAYVFSLAIILAGAISVIAHGGFRMGVDFAGGTLIEFRFDRALEADALRSSLANAGWSDAEIQSSEGGKDFLIRIPTGEERQAGEKAPSEKMAEAIQADFPGIKSDLLREEVVGPRVGKELRGKALWAVLLSLAGILIYVGVRYEFKFALGGVAALAHDTLVILSFISFTNKEITIPIIAALLTIGGYSINDTIVVFDRIRERLKGSGRAPDAALFDLAINQTLGRTIITGLTVIFTIEALLFMGGRVIHDFAFAMLIGVGFGTYSSVFVASALALDMTLASERRKAAADTRATKLKA